MMAASISIDDVLEQLKETAPEIVLMKVMEAYNYVNWNKGGPAHYQHQGCHVSQIKGLISPRIRFLDAIQHRNGDLTLITNYEFFIRFSNR